MEILKKYATKKLIFMSAFIFSGIYTVLYIIGKLTNNSTVSADLTSLNSLMSTISTIITVVQIVFYVSLAVALIGTVLGGVYFFTKDKSDYVMLGEFVGYALSFVLLALSVSGINALVKVVKVMASGDYSSILSMDYSGMQSALERTGDCMNYFQWLMIILFVFNLFIFLVMKNIIKLNGFSYSLDENAGAGGRIISYDPQTGQPIYENVSQSSGTNSNVDLGAFFKSKNGKIVIGVIAAIVVAFGGYKIYDTYFNKTTIKVLENVEVEFNGYDGHGAIDSCRIGDIDYDKTDSELASFINSISLDYDYSNYNLKNGDEVEITAIYDHDKAEALKLDMEETTKKVKVKGLIERYEKASEVPDKVVNNVKKLMDEEVKESYDDRQSSYSSYKSSFVSMYYAYDESDSSMPNDSCIGIYKIDYTTTFGSSTETETYYIAAYVEKINGAYSEDKKHSVYTMTLYDSQYDHITDESQVEDAIKDDYSFEECKLSKFE